MFDTKLPPGVVMLQPFAEESSIKKVGVQVHFRIQNSIPRFVPRDHTFSMWHGYLLLDNGIPIDAYI